MSRAAIPSRRRSSRLLRGLLAGGILSLAGLGVASASTTINHQFTAATINPGDVSQYRITIANSSTVPLTAAAVTEVLPSQITISSPVNILNTCGFTVSAATPGTSTVFLTAGTIPAGTGVVDGQCFFQIDVTATTPGNWVAVIPANTTPNATTSGYTAKESGVVIFNTTPASATLAVNTLNPPTGSKTFSPASSFAGDPVTLTITLANPNAAATMPLTSFTDTLPAGMQVVSANALPVCSGTGAVNGAVTFNASSVTLTGGTIGSGGSCVITSVVTVPSITTLPQVFANVVAAGAIGNTRGLTSASFNKSISINTPISVTKTFAPVLIPGGQPSLMTITINNASPANALTISSFADNLTGLSLKILSTASSPVVAPANPAVVCTGTGSVNGTLSAPPDLLDQTITLTGATAGPGGKCTITAYLTSNVDGAHVNSIPANAVVNPNNYQSNGPVTGTLTANAQLTVAKTATPSSVAPGQWTRFDVAISNFSGGPVTGVSFRDLLPKTGTDQMTLFDSGSGVFTTSAGCSGGTFTGLTPLGASTGVAPVVGDAGLQWASGTIVAGVGASPGLCTISIYAKVPATATSSPVETFVNSIPVGSITGTGPGGPVSNVAPAGTVNVVTIASGAITKAISPASIPQGATTTMTLTIFNRTVSPLTNVSLTDNLPSGLTLAANPAPSNTCGGSLMAFPNDTKLVLTGGTVAKRPDASVESSCVITAKITGNTIGSYTNTIHPADFSDTELVTIPANVTAPLTITTGLSMGTKAFNPTAVALGGVARAKITLFNTSSGALTNVSVDDNTFSAGLSVANPANAATSCAGSPTLVVNPGTTRAQLLGATIAAGGSCDFSFDVVTSSGAGWTNTIPIGKITSAEGVSNTAAVTGTLNLAAAAININKSFTPVVVTGGVPSTLQIDVINTAAIVINGVGFTDTFPAGIEVYSVPNASTTCAGATVTAIPGDGKVTLSGATLAASQTCRVTLSTTATRFLNLTNTIPARSVVSQQGYTNPSPTSATLSTLQGLGVMKAFSPSYVVPNQVSTLKMRLVSTFDPNAPTPVTLTGVSYTDTLPNGVFISATPNPTTTCSGTGPGGLAVVSTANGGASGSVTVSQGTIPAGTNCSITVDVVASALGSYANTIPANAVTSDQGIPNATAASATLFVVARPTVSKAFGTLTINPGGTSRLTVTISNGAAIALTGVSLTDTLPSGLEIASTPATGGTCTAGGGVVSASAAGSTLGISGASIAAGANCTFFANVTGNTPGTYINNINPGAIADDQTLTNPGSAQATLRINGPPSVTKAFNPVSIAAGGTSTLTITLVNPNAAPAPTLSAAFVDALPGNVFVAATPNLVTNCTAGSVTAIAGATSITYASGASIPVGGCTISVDVTSSVPGTYTNVIAAGQLSTSAGVNQQPAVASLAVGPGALVPPTMSKTFAPGTILVNGISSLTITLGNSNAGPLTLSSTFTDSLPTNVVVATPPNVGGSCTTASVTASAGGGTIAYASGSAIPAGGCPITVDVTSSVAGSYTNSLPASALVTDGGSPSLGATAGLVVQALTPPTVVKFFNPGTINPGAVSTLTISLGNSNGSAAALTAAFTDTLPANVVVAGTPNAGTSCSGGTVTTGGASVTFTGGSIPSGGCVITVDVTSNVPGGPYTNTIPAGSLQTSVGSNTGAATANLFVNPFQPPSVFKSFAPTVIGAGGTSRLTISLSNGNASDSTLTADFVDTFPGPGLVIGTPSNLAFSAGCTAASIVAVSGASTVTYKSGGALPGNGGCTIQVDLTSSTVRSYVNTIAAGALVTTAGSNAVGSSSTLQVLALPTVSKAFSPVSIPLGANSSLTLTLGNTNASALTLNANFIDTLPTNLILATPATLTGSCTAANVVVTAGGSTIQYKNGASIPAGGCTITVPVTSTLAGSYTNAIATGDLSTTIGSNPAPASATLTILQADLSITKTDGVAAVVPGTSTTYTIVVSNAGPSAVTSAPVVDTLPAAIASATWTCSATAGSSCAAPGGSGSIASTVSLLSGGSATYVVVANIGPAATGSVVNTATVTAPAGVAELNPANNSATDTDTLTPQADMQVVKTGPATVVPGQNATYTITVTNAGPSTALAANLTDALPGVQTFVSLASPGGWSCTTPAVGAGGTISCNLATFASATPAVFTLVVKVPASVLTGTVFLNTATVSSSTADPTPGNNSSSTSATAAPSADLAIVKTGPATAVPGGPNVVFTLVVTNNGPSDAQGVTVTDPTPANLVFVSNAGACTGAFPCSLGTLAPLATRTITTTYQIPSGYPAPTPISNTATVASTTTDSVSANNSSTATVAVPAGVADVAVTKTVTNPAPAVGSNVTYTITASDLGPSDATLVAITDVLPSGLTFVSALPSQGTYSAATGVWTLGTVTSGASQTLSIVATVTQAGTIVNTAAKTAERESDPNSSNNAGSAVINGPAAIADIQVQKIVDVAAPTVGSNVTFTVTVVNAGPSAATNVVVTDLLPPGLTFVSAAPATGAYASATGVWTIGPMASVATTTLGITATVTATGTFVNVARKTAETEFDPNTGNDQASAVVMAGGGGGALADLSIQKTDSPDPVFAGQPLTYTLLITNHGPAGATGVTVADPLPASVAFVSVLPSQGVCIGSTTIACALGNLGAGNSATVTIVVTPSAASAPSITNTAAVTAAETDPNPADNSSTAPTTVTPLADVALLKTVSNPAPRVSEAFTFTVTVKNNGPSTATGVAVTDVIPANLSFSSAVASQGSYVAGTGIWTIGTLVNGQTETLVLTVVAAVPGPFTNTATKTSEVELDPNTANDTASAGGTVLVVADLTIVKSHAPPTFFRGSTGTFTLTVSNVGTGPTAGLVTVSDTLPVGLTPTLASGSGWGCSVAAPTVTCTRSDVLPAGNAYPGISVTASVALSAAASVSNTATVGGGGDITPGNDSSTDGVTVTTQADLGITKSDGVASVVPGATTTYTIVVTNAGPSPVTGAPVTDTLPASISSATWTCTASVGSSCGAPGGSGSIASTVSLLSGGSATYVLVATVAPSASGSLVNTASVTPPGGVTDPNPGDNTSTDTDTLTPQADMQVVKTGPATVVPGQNVSYAITVTNAGLSTASAASLADTLPAGTTFVSLTSPGGWSCTTPAVGAGGTVNCTLATLASSAPAVFTLVVNVSPAVLTGATVANTATVASSTPDPTPGNNSSTTTGTAAPSADVSIVKTGPPTAVPGGPNVVFTSVITNNGPSDAQGVTVIDPTPANLVFVSNSGACTGPFPCSLGTIASLATRTITTTYQIPSGYPAPAPINNIASVSSTTPDPVPGNDSSTATVLVPTGVADVAVAKTVSNPAPVLGSNVTFTITASDLGPSDATGVELTDILPSGLTFVSALPSQGAYDPVTGVWMAGTIPLGSSATLSIAATVTQAGTIVNTATKTAGNETDPNPSNNSGSAVVNGPAAVADIQVQKTVDVAAPLVGANITFTVTVVNAGPSAATNVAITDALPPGLTFVSAAPATGSFAPATGIWTIGSMANGATTTLGITATVTAAGTYVNVARKTSETELDPNTGNDQASAVAAAGGGGGTLADLSIQKTDSPDPVFAGQPLTYTLLVTNHGPAGASGVTISDPLPVSVAFVSAAASQGGCTGTTTVTCTLGGIAAGNSASVTIVVTPTAASVPAITNTATVSANETDPNPSDNSSTTPTTVTPVADIAILKTVSNPAPLVTQTFTFTVTATNNGPSTAQGVVVTDVLPGNLALVTAAPTQGTYTPGSGAWSIGTLANGQTETLLFTVTAVAPGAFTNTATKTAETELDPNPANDTASVSGVVGTVADLTIGKTHAPATFLRGSTGTFSLAVSNLGTGPTAGLVTVADTLPAGLTPTAASGAGWSCSVAAPTVTCTRGDALAAAGAWPVISVTASVAQSAPASVTNTATVTGGGDITPANDSSTDVVPITAQADLMIVKTGPSQAIPGTNIVYTLVVTNNGPSDAPGTVVTDPTPPNLTFISNSGACATPFPCNLGTLASGASATITATFGIPAGYTAPTPIVNSASVTAAPPDPTPGNNASSTSTSVAADLEVVKTASPLIVPVGAPFTYQIVVTNRGPSSATGVTLVDPLPAQLTFQSVTTTQGTCSGTSTVSCALGTIANGGSATVVITVAQASASTGPVSNTATVTANEFDPDPTNNSSTAVSSVGNASIPTLSEFGMALLALALGLAGAIVLKKTQL